MMHELKTWPQYYYRVFDGQKNFEVRKDDRNFEIGDVLKLREWDPETKDYTGRELFRRVTYILRGGSFGIEKGYVVMGIK